MTKIYDPYINKCKWDLIEKDELFINLKSIQQNQKWHKEGNVYTHTCMVVQEMLNSLNNVTQYDLREILFYAALLHDVGKLTTTVKDSVGTFHSPGHEKESVKLAELWLEQHNIDKYMIEAIVSLIENHMRIYYVADFSDPIKSVQKIANSLKYVPFRYLILLKKCDCRGAWYDIDDQFDKLLDDTLDLYYEHISFKPNENVVLEKLEDNIFHGHHPNNINKGYIASGQLLDSVTVGLGTFVPGFHTSSVTEIIDKNHFRTLNSIYKITKNEHNS